MRSHPQSTPVHGRTIYVQHVHAASRSPDFAAGQVICILLCLLLLTLLLGGLLQALLLRRRALSEGPIAHLALHSPP